VGGSKAGVFSFFNPANIELIVKALDATDPDLFPHPAHWVFYGALSTVEYWITVTDTATGAANTYHNPPGELCGRADTGAFPAGPQAPATAAGRSRGRRGGSRAAPAPAAARPAAGAAGACVPDAATLCLAGGRVAVTVDWTDQRTLESGAGNAVAGSGTTGYFWFFNPQNVELVVKVLDNSQSPAANWWVFYGALSDVGYTIRVLDTATGTDKSYANDPGDFCGRADTQGFPDH
jgi:hypothetical protein